MSILIIWQGAPGPAAGFSSSIPDAFADTIRRRKRSLRRQMVADEPEPDVFDMAPSGTLGK